MKKNRKYGLLLILIFAIAIILEISAPEKLDWKYYFNNNKTTPYGCSILFNILQDLFPEQEIETLNESFYRFFNRDIERTNSNYIIITTSFDPDPLDFEKLLDYIKKGNHVFLSAYEISTMVKDTLGFSTNTKYVDQTLLPGQLPYLEFLNPKLKKAEPDTFTQLMFSTYVETFDTSRTILLGRNWNKEANFIKIPYGKGIFYYHTQPLPFTNYHLLYSNYSYVSTALSYLPIQKTYWDEYYKPFRQQQASQSPLRVIFQKPALKAAYALLMVAVIIFILFNARRRQRIVPVITPPANTSLEFIDTISNLHIYQSNYRDIALKRYMHYLDNIESRYYIHFQEDDPDFLEKLSLKSGVDITLLNKIQNMANTIYQSGVIGSDTLVKLNNLIEKFYKNSI